MLLYFLLIETRMSRVFNGMEVKAALIIRPVLKCFRHADGLIVPRISPGDDPGGNKMAKPVPATLPYKVW
jgi:hypothetical protein